MVTYRGCPPGSVDGGVRGGTGGCAAHERATLQAITADDDLAVVFLIARYSQARIEQGDGFFVELGRVARALADADKRVVLVYPSPEYRSSVPMLLARAGALLRRRSSEPERRTIRRAGVRSVLRSTRARDTC